MAFSPIAFIAPNYRDFKNYWLKAYEPGTTTPKPLGLNSTGGATVAKLELNADGFLSSAGGSLIIPYIEGAYDAWLFPTEAEADANDTGNAERVADNIIGVNGDILANAVVFKFDELSDAVNEESVEIAFAGSAVTLKERTTGKGGGGMWDYVLASTVTTNTYNIVQCVGIPTLALVLRVKEPLDLAMLGAVADGVTNNSPELGIANDISSLAVINARHGQYRFSAPLPTLSDNFSLLIIGNDAIVEPTDETLINGFKLDGGVANGYPYMPELSNKKIEVVCGSIRQEAPSSVVSITSVGTTATATKIAHGYANGDNVDIRGVNNSESLYNGYFAISNVTDDTFDYTLASGQTSPAPSTLGITSHRPAVWNWIKDSAHEPIGVDDSQPVIAAGSSLSIPFTKEYSRILSFMPGADETLANSISFVCGASVGLSTADIKASANITLAADVYWDGADWITSEGVGQGLGGVPVAIRDVSYSGGTVTLTHDWLPGSAVSADMFGNGGAITPFLPLKRSSADEVEAFNFLSIDTTATYYVGAETTELSFSLTKTFTGGINLDGSDGSSPSLRLYNGNIWFYGVFEV